METIEGVITELTFRNEDNGFTVAKIELDNIGPHYVCVGVMPTVERGHSVKLNGRWENHKRFGRQFTVESYELIRPRTLEAIERFLSSGIICGIGKSRARAIIQVFGLQTLDILDKEPQRLLGIAGIGKKLYSKIIQSWQQQKQAANLMLFLQPCGVSTHLALKIFKTYGAEAQQKISQNPYCLIDDIWGVGFKKADAMAQHMGYPKDSFKRIRAGLLHVLSEAAAQGHVYLPKDELVKQACEILQITDERVIYSLDYAINEKLLINEHGHIYLKYLYEAETSVAQLLLSRIAASDKIQPKWNKNYIRIWLKKYCASSGWGPDPLQAEAIEKALCSSIFLLTGGPGTGKTTTLQAIVSFFRQHNLIVSMAAPTGRAAQRMGSIAGLKAQTIHRLLEFRPSKEIQFFARNALNPIQADVVIIDEVSMIDIVLMRNLLEALAAATALILVGDSNQLPSVGPGYVLGDLIASLIIPHVHLTTIFRQAAESKIVRSAHEVLRGNVPRFANDKNDDCFFISAPKPQQCLETIVELVSKRLPRSYNFNPIEDIQVLSPMHKGILGTENLNSLLQNALNSSSDGICRGSIIFRRGDRVMQLRNNYDLGVFNGDIGKISSIEDNEVLIVDFDGVKVRYDYRYLDELSLAYCISIHKSQGCEFPCCVLPVMTQHYIMLQRNLLYTALTRARSLCVLIGSYKALAIMTANNDVQTRYCSLASKLRQLRFHQTDQTVVTQTVAADSTKQNASKLFTGA